MIQRTLVCPLHTAHGEPCTRAYSSKLVDLCVCVCACVAQCVGEWLDSLHEAIHAMRRLKRHLQTTRLPATTVYEPSQQVNVLTRRSVRALTQPKVVGSHFDADTATRQG
jgi:hypothetical protein